MSFSQSDVRRRPDAFSSSMERRELSNLPEIGSAPSGTLSEVGRDLALRSYARRGLSPPLDLIRVLLVDDHGLVRAGLKSLLHACTDIFVVGEASGGQDIVALAALLRPDVVVMDLAMPTGDGLTATQLLREAAPDVRVLIVSMYTEQEKLLPLLAAGARGFLCKSAVEKELIDAIRVLVAGDVYVRPAISHSLASSRAPSRQRVDAQGRLQRLSHREQSVVALTAEGFNGPEIGRQLGITAKTVDTYKQRIEEKLGLSHRSQYVRFALEADLLPAVPR